MKRIVLFISSLQKGGSERVMVNLAEYFHGRGYEVILVTQYKQENEYDISSEIRRVYSEPDESELQESRLKNFITRFRKLRDIWKSYKPDVILSFLGKNNLMAIVTSLFLPVKTAVSVRGEPTMEYEGRLMQMIAKFVFRFADGAVFQTRQAFDFFPKAVRKKSVILPNPLNAQFLNRRYDGEREEVIVSAGRLDENKNHAMLIHAFDKIASEFPKLRLVIYGDGELREDLQALIDEKGLSERAELAGSVPDLADKMCSAKIFALTSNTEGMPNSIVEAMALGIPVVSTDCPCGGPAMLIEDKVNGILVPVGDAFALSDAFRLILTDLELAQRLSENAYNTAMEFEPDKVDSEWEDFLVNL